MSKRAEQERVEFEAWASGSVFGLTEAHFRKFDNGFYANYPTQCYWEVWQASRAAMKADPVREAAPDLLEALHEGRRAIGEHLAPDDCYATGPMAGDPIRDLVQCPACSFIAMYDEAITKATGADDEH